MVGKLKEHTHVISLINLSLDSFVGDVMCVCDIRLRVQDMMQYFVHLLEGIMCGFGPN